MEFTSTPIYKKAFSLYIRRGTAIEATIKSLLAAKAADDQQDQSEAKSYYVWATQGDNKVRASHEANEGQIFSFDDPPDTGNPGDEDNCRCDAIPYEKENPYPDAIEPVYPELFLPVFRFARLIARFARSVNDINADRLTINQANNLNRFNAKLPKDAGKIEILGGKKGQRIFRSDVPARNIPGSFARYEKVVDGSGKTISYTKTTFAPDGRIVHVKVK